MSKDLFQYRNNACGIMVAWWHHQFKHSATGYHCRQSHVW